MKHLVILIFLTVGFMAHAQDGDKTKVIKDYFSGWLTKDWSVVERNLSRDFTFTSPAPDDHIDIKKFKEKCWVQADYIKQFYFPEVVEKGDHAFAIVHVVTTDGRVIRNIELFTFEGSKVKSIEVFFGGNGQGFPTNAK